MGDAFVRFRRFHWTDTSGNKKRCSVPASQVVSDAADDGYSSGVDSDSYEVFMAGVSAAGASYQVGDVLTASGGTCTTAASFQVTAVTTGGGVSEVNIITRGKYSVAPGTPNNVTGGSGAGAALALTIAAFRDIYIGGGGGGGDVQCKITQLFGADYFGVRRWDGAATSGDQFLVARSYASRGAFGAAGYTYTSTGENSRTSDDGSGETAVNPEDQVLTPAFNIGDVVSVSEIDHTGVSVAGVELKFIEVATEREWTHQASVAQISGVWVLTP